MKAATMRIPLVAGVTAGRNIPDDATDWEIVGFRDVRLIESADRFARYAAVKLGGDSLEQLGILDGDIAIMRITRDYEDGRLGIWQTPHGRTVKFAHFDPDNFVVLHNDNGWRMTWEASEVRLLGLVERIERDLI